MDEQRRLEILETTKDYLTMLREIIKGFLETTQAEIQVVEHRTNLIRGETDEELRRRCYLLRTNLRLQRRYRFLLKEQKRSTLQLLNINDEEFIELVLKRKREEKEKRRRAQAKLLSNTSTSTGRTVTMKAKKRNQSH